MLFDTYKIQDPELASYIQYVLFNYSDHMMEQQLITSFANNNICLGIIKEKMMIGSSDRIKRAAPKAGIHSYLSGMYLQPHCFGLCGSFDEICIDFTPLGYYRYFKIPLRTYVFGEDVLAEAWGKPAHGFFEGVFSEQDFQQRGCMIEAFLKEKLLVVTQPFLQQCFYYIHGVKISSLKELAARLRCSEKRIVRTFTAQFDITPKDYFRILRFRNALQLMSRCRGMKLTQIAYEAGFYDQSHFIKDIRFFTGKTPGYLSDDLYDIKNDVIVALR
ncbi:AraC family transcriptional regulator [Niabella drilacis]|uniref:Helix-turn-helix domain-containing protein n=1 Tax=Niabella drilacis (strain DSM 25811 / CCM 8410 / CCUG 62505 / LMG 26954 / E90) TaxID=1285928 RepID=A0A1G6ZFP4_NIADE|nr:helix-turn-helix domain-containing protein [Niabella drilacis]SDE01458.1 Helix-turn-helix domain-containing protein [Niabella drilacis]